MGLNRFQRGSTESRLKTRTELEAKNQALRAKLASLEAQLEDTQLALCDVYEAMLGGEG